MEGKICHWQSHIKKCYVIDSLKFNRHRAGSAYITRAKKGWKGPHTKSQEQEKLESRRKQREKGTKVGFHYLFMKSVHFSPKFCCRAVQLNRPSEKTNRRNVFGSQKYSRCSLISRQKLIFLLCRKLHSICRHTKNLKKKMKAEYQSAKNVRCFLISLSGLTDCPLSARNMRAITKTAPKPR